MKTTFLCIAVAFTTMLFAPANSTAQQYKLKQLTTTDYAKIENTIYVKGRKSQGHGRNANAPLKIDAQALLDMYADFVWAKDVVLDRIAICEMGAKQRVENGVVVGEEYTEVASVPLLPAHE